MKTFSKARFALTAPCVCVFLLLISSPVFARSLRVDKFDATAHVRNDGSVNFAEQIAYTFSGQYQGVYRDIPVGYPGPRGSNYTLFLHVDKVTDEDGTPLKFEKNTRNGYLHLKIYVPGAVNSTKTVNIEYTAANAVKFFPDYDEFYWNVTGNDSPVPIQSAATTVYFPPEANGALRAQAYSGVYRSTDQVPAHVEGSVVSAETDRPLPMRGGLTIDVAVEKGILKEPGALTKAARFLRSNPILFLPLWAFAMMFTLWWFKGRDPDPGMSVAPMYEPPQKMGPAEVGTLIDGSVDPRDITSVLVDLAVRGYVKIVETQHKGFLSTTKDYELHLIKNRGEWSDLTDYEQAMLSNVFGGSDVVLLSSLRNHFYTALPAIKSGIMGALKRKGMYTVDPDSAMGYWGVGVVLVALPFVLGQWLGVADFLSSIPMLIGAGLISLGIIIILGRLLTATSLKGARTRVQVRGFQEFMNRVDADRLKRMPPDTFEKFLPYAMALGVEHHWAKAFEGIIQNPPTWYQSSDGRMFSTFYFVNSLGSMTQTATSAFVSAPRASSSGSGWSSGGGGGFSGGGFGGGGTGGF